MRILVRRIHLSASLIAGLWLAISGVSGAILVWGDTVERAAHPELFLIRQPEERAPLGEVVRAAERAAGGRVLRLRLAGVDTPVHEAWIDCDRCTRVWIDPSTAAVNGVRSADGTARGFLHELHRRMLGGERGATLAGIGGLILAGIAGSGVVLWWPRGSWIRALRVGWRAGWKRLTYDVHRVVGVAVAPMLLLSGLTGAYFVFHGPVDRLVAWIDGTPPAAQAVAMPADPDGTLDAWLLRAAAVFPDATPTWLTPSRSAAEPVLVRLRRVGEAHPNGRSFVRIDAASGRIVSVIDALAAPAGRRVLDRLYPIHIGRFGGTAHRVLLTAVGLTPGLLLLSGCAMWWNRSLRRRLRSASGSAAPRSSHPDLA